AAGRGKAPQLRSLILRVLVCRRDARVCHNSHDWCSRSADHLDLPQVAGGGFVRRGDGPILRPAAVNRAMIRAKPLDRAMASGVLGEGERVGTLTGAAARLARLRIEGEDCCRHLSLLYR